MAEIKKAITKLDRGYLRHFLNTNFSETGTVDWERIGEDNDDLSTELSPSTEIVKNVWDETRVIDNGYEPSMSVDTYYADTTKKLYPQLKNIAFNRLTGDDCKTDFLEILIDTVEGPHSAWKEDCIVKPQSYGGPQGGVNIPFTITPCGNRIKGTVVITNKVPVFTADAEG